jgi:16S rRNA (uracil1498-N3)-methyltransferase
VTQIHRIFLDPGQFEEGGRVARLTGQDHAHLARVLRARAGQTVVLLDGLGGAFRATLRSVDKRETVAEVEGTVAVAPEPSVSITVAQALGKSDKFEQVLQHGTEAGASGFVPLLTDRSVVALPSDRAAERLLRWRAIAKGAAEQSERARIPGVGPPAPFESAVRDAVGAGSPTFVLHPSPPAEALRDVLDRLCPAPPRLWLLVGPEGGWSERELAIAREAGCTLVSLGGRVLRTETAALVAISQILYHYSRPERSR